jgi:hypothetical protein
MFIRVFVVLLRFPFLGLWPLLSQDQSPVSTPPVPIATDRPSFTNFSVVLASGSFQVEKGLLVATGKFFRMGPEILLRLGVAPRTKLCTTVPN